MSPRYVYHLCARSLPLTIGGKAANLRRLAHKGFAVPTTFVCPWDAFSRYLAHDPGLRQDITSELAHLLDGNCLYAVRSSANIEDTSEHSFAGQFRTHLNVSGISNIYDAVEDIWATAQAPNVRSYLQKSLNGQADVQMAVMIQEMVAPVFSGVAFSRNPITSHDEVVIEAVAGSGVALVQDGVTPMRWINKWGQWLAIPPEHDTVGAELIGDIVQQTKRIAKALKRPVDLEWVYDGQSLFWLQARDITSIKDTKVYSNAMTKEMLPGIIKPLVWSVNIPLVCGAWAQLLEELLGPADYQTETLVKSFHYRAYFNMAAIGRTFESLGMPPESLQSMMGIKAPGAASPRMKMSGKLLRVTPRLFGFLRSKWDFGREIDRVVAELETGWRQLSAEPKEAMSEGDLIERVDRLFAADQRIAYYNILGPLLMFMFNFMLRRQLARIGVDFAHLDLEDDAEQARWHPNPHLARLSVQFRQLDQATRQRLCTCTCAEFIQMPGIGALQEQVAAFIEQFGHLSDSGNDFSCVPWRENAELILRLITTYEQHEDTRAQKIAFADLRLRGMQRFYMPPLFRRACSYKLYRDRIGFLYTYGYGLFRSYFLELGSRLAARGVLATRDDIFYLYQNEVREIVANQPQHDYAALVEQRKQEIAQCRDAQMPGLIYGDAPPPLVAPTDHRLVGTPTSPGYYTGPIKVIHSLDEFAKLSHGDVLVAPYSDVGWTPLFAKAGAVIAESGGILSHSSIVAREFNIPAVVSVAGVMRLADGTRVTVDGYKGEIAIHGSDPEDSTTSGSPLAEPR